MRASVPARVGIAQGSELAVCACSHDFVCSKCAGTPFDPRYEEDEHEPMSLDEFEDLTREPFTRWKGWT